jgi:urea ABC transporter ATP-binding protein UrtE
VTLEVEGLSGGYGKAVDVLRDVSFRASDVEIVCILGRNGTGKTTLMKAVMGLLPSARGSIKLAGREIAGLPTHRRARLGIGYVPQGRGMFPEATLEENLRYGMLLAERSMHDALPEGVFDVFPWMRTRLRQTAGTLSGGEQQMLAIARVLVGEPRLLLLDEPTEGLAPAMVGHVRNVIADIRDSGNHSILLVEQNLRFALTLASRGYVLQKGQIVAAGDSDELQQEEIIGRHLSI